MKTKQTAQARKKSTVGDAMAEAMGGVKIENNKIVEPNSPPIHIMESNIPERKMAAIENLSRAILECSKALNSTNVSAIISHCNITCAPGVGGPPGIQIG